MSYGGASWHSCREKAFWEEDSDRIFIHGTKTAAADRVIPKFGSVVQPGCTHKVLHSTLKEVESSMVLYDLRRTFAHWLESARVPESRIRVYMGHGPKNVTGGYMQHDVEPYLEDDVELMDKYFTRAKRA